MTMPTPDDLAAIIDRFTGGEYPQDYEFFEEHNCTRYEADCELLAKAFIAHRQQVAALVAEFRRTASVLSDQALAGAWLDAADKLDSLGAKP